MFGISEQKSLTVRVQPSGHKSRRMFYRFDGQACWYNIGKFGSIDLANARILAQSASVQVAMGINPRRWRQARAPAGDDHALVVYFIKSAQQSRLVGPIILIRE